MKKLYLVKNDDEILENKYFLKSQDKNDYLKSQMENKNFQIIKTFPLFGSRHYLIYDINNLSEHIINNNKTMSVKRIGQIILIFSILKDNETIFERFTIMESIENQKNIELLDEFLKYTFLYHKKMLPDYGETFNKFLMNIFDEEDLFQEQYFYFINLNKI